MGKKEIFTIALGSVIGWGAFILPGNVFLPNYGVLNTMIGFGIAIIMLVFIENSYSKVMTRVPESGGEYSFATTLLGKKQGFITGWGLLLAYLSIIPLNATAVPMVLDAVFPFYSKGQFLYSVSGYPVYLNDILVSLSIIILFTFINIKGIKGALKAQNLLVFALVSSLVLITAISILHIGDTQTTNFNSNWGELSTSSVVRIIAFAPWAFIGFDAVAQLSGDHDVDSKTVSRVTMLAIVIGAVIYNVLNVVTALGINKQELTDSAWATGHAVKILVGSGIFYFLAVAMFGAVVSGLNGFFISSSRLVNSMSEDYDVGKRGKGVKMTGNGTIPRWIIYFISICAIIVPFFGRTALLWFVDLSSIGASVAYFMTCLCAYKIAQNGKDRVMSSLGMFVSLAFLVFLLTPIFDSNISLPSYFSLAFWIALGLGVYFYIRNRKQLI
ncbi:APC family permease [Psychrobacter sp. FDAARGOS_221]|uniref:APC family permease n=1 Tax=Psychrobacter sp. FDAARGOS_221 TaxID=1975705 RepID=UPI00187D2121|nr:APC family permease [Psychrobacter sp. FDAARGOS_221]